MIEIKYNGKLGGETFTIRELIKFLDQYEKDIPVFAEWEGVTAYINADNIRVERINKGDRVNKKSIIINVDIY